MAKAKKEPIKVFLTAGFADNLIRIAWRNNLNFEKLKELNPNIKGPSYMCRMGQKVRLK